jgi:translation initiation factor IF-2
VVELKLILKADSSGSLEAIKHAAQQITIPDSVSLKLIHADV